ncbi:TPA: signal peptidase II [Candidatus Woesearchaeota archaeon]|nr:signal peptidase II [Candidatus Woesearchaeota archaeon]HIH12346.1 signal peptidase II [Candidatus Woesearchaeota archaeon]
MVTKTIQKHYSSVLFFGIALLVVALDQLTKYIIITRNVSWSSALFQIHLVKNTGAGFGILKGQILLLGFISLVVALIIIFAHKKISQEKIPLLLFSLLLGGVIGNFIDRMFRHYVIDFIDVGFWPVFNIADAAITVSIIILVIYYWRK